ncbi:S-adenosyl-L-methionine-dependent methyltransferase [Dactylonectria macrodidyma]|uniref:S-adenosyl-L-methionine-dependent methyltransferase n=1 Tax=Dactylonectria macrodidyma TaxID=307937 RepID=A0A9P9I882_9HYPO|nr:S-adenosyl-L-methionine-dependent methyltransferase [Dactylonectria macrodidyma]
MSVCFPTQQRLAARDLALRLTDGSSSWRTLPLLPDATDHGGPSSDPEHAADGASEPEASDSPNSPAKPKSNKRKRGESSAEDGRNLVHFAPKPDDSDAPSTPSDHSADHDEHSNSASSAATVVADSRDSEPMSPTTDEGADCADGDADSTASIDSEYWDYVQENERSYHADVKVGYGYLMPNDDKQNEALDRSFREVWLLFCKGDLYLAPIKMDIQNALDIGTGTGSWALDYADKVPSAAVIGTDISPIQPKWIPPNLHFQMDDCNDEPTFKKNLFDFIHVRDMAGSISDCDLFAKRQFQLLRPGGYFEIRVQAIDFESDDESHKNHIFNKWRCMWKEVGSKPNRSLTFAEDGTMGEAMKRVGFINIKTLWRKMPVGGWPEDEKLKEVGRLNQEALLCDLEGLALRAATGILGWTYGEATDFVSTVRQGLQSPEHHLWRRATVIYGQKPK